MIKPRLPLFLLALFVLTLFCSEALAQARPRGRAPGDAEATAVILTMLICGGLGALLGLALQIGIAVWIYKDADARGENAMMWALLGFFLTWVGLIIWLVVRPKDRKRRRYRR